MKDKTIPSESENALVTSDQEAINADFENEAILEDNFENDDSEESLEPVEGSEAELEYQVTFYPPLYRQRYTKIAELLADERWVHAMSRVVDFGSAECKLTRYLTKALPRVREICHVDIDGDLLSQSGRNAEPLFVDLIQQREETPVVVKLLEGDITQVDQRLVDVDAVVAIELIEHLESRILQKVPESIFGQIRPKLAIFTTPNREFNVVFENFEGPFRHWDHKFEFTRSEFEDWVTTNITNRYPEYSVLQYSGVGDGPEHLGFCSQYVVIVRRDFYESVNAGDIHYDLETDTAFAAQRQFCGPDDNASTYRTVTTYEYPMSRDTRTREEKLFDDTHFYANHLAEISEEWEMGEAAVIKLVDILDYQRIQAYDTNVQELVLILENRNYQIRNNVAVVMPFYEAPDSDCYEEENVELEGARLNYDDNDDESWD